jgi:hypothetical protein
VEVSNSGQDVRVAFILPTQSALLSVQIDFYSPGRNSSELATPASGGLLSRIEEAAPVPETIERCQLVRNPSAKKWRLENNRMWCYIPVHPPNSAQSPYRTDQPQREGWLPHGELTLEFHVEPDPNDPRLYRLFRDLNDWQAPPE